jgi:hypothetical protein
MINIHDFINNNLTIMFFTNIVSNIITNTFGCFYHKNKRTKERKEVLMEDIDFWLNQLPQPGEAIQAVHVQYIKNIKDDISRKIYTIDRFQKTNLHSVWKKKNWEKITNINVDDLRNFLIWEKNQLKGVKYENK